MRAQKLIAASPSPSQILAIPVGTAYGLWLGAALIWTGWMVVAVLQYGLSRRTADDIDLSSLLERTPRWMRRFPAGHPLFLIVARQLPLGPHIVNVGAGVLHVPLWRHVWCAAIAVVPEAVLLAGISVGLFLQGRSTPPKEPAARLRRLVRRSAPDGLPIALLARVLQRALRSRSVRRG